MERGIRKILTSVTPFARKIFEKIILKPLQFRKDSSSPRMTEQLQTLQRLLESTSRDLKVLWIS